MPAAARARYVNIRLKPRTPLKVVQAIREQYSKYIETVDDKDDSEDLVDIKTTDWYKKYESGNEAEGLSENVSQSAKTYTRAAL